MSRGTVYDSSGDPVTTSLKESVIGSLSYNGQYDSDTEIGLRRFNENSTRVMMHYEGFINSLKRDNLFDNVTDLWLIPQGDSNTFGVQFIGSAALSSSGDHTYTSNGISGIGSFSFDTKFNPSTDISDINNFSIGLYINDNEASGGVEFGADDSTNSLILEARTANNVIVNVGTATESISNTNSTGFYFINVRLGTIYVYRDGIEIGVGTSVAGSFPNLDIYLGAKNLNSVEDDFSSKTFSGLIIYNGLLLEAGVIDITQRMEIFQTQLNRGHARS